MSTDAFGMPRPRSVSCVSDVRLPLPGQFTSNGPTPAGDRVAGALQRLNSQLAILGGTGSVPLMLAVQSPNADLLLGVDESYRLRSNAEGVHLSAATDIGLLHGLQTLQQLLFLHDGLPDCEIEDQPRFPWRGLLLDVARHYLSLDTLQRTLDCMAAAKLNVLHLHLTDDQGFRFHSEAYPRLASKQAYSAAELRALVAYADARGIRIVPELDMPGHVTSWLLAYPEWGTQAALETDRFGVHTACLNPIDEQVFAAIEQLITELASIFPDRYLHIGGDEVHPAWWQGSSEIQAHMQAHGLADVAAVQAQFNARLHAILERSGRRMLVWDEALHPQLAAQATTVTVQNWRGATTRDRALAAGHPCVVSAGYYLDLHYPAHWHYRYDPEADQASLLALEDELLGLPAFAHVAEGMRWTHQWRDGALHDVPAAESVLGGEACMWGELVDDGTLDTRLWSRLPAIAERFWSAPTVTDLDAMYERLAHFTEYLERSATNRLSDRRVAQMSALGVNPEWQPLLDWLEPVKWYGRLLGEAALAARLQGTEMPKARPYQMHTPLNQLIDFLPVESLASRSLDRALALQAPAQALQPALEQWHSLIARNDCPALLAGQRDRLALLTELVTRRLAGDALDSAARSQLETLLLARDDLLLAPVFVLQDWLLQP